MLKYTLLYLLLQFLHFAVCIDYDGWLNIKLEHNVGCNRDQFCDRGNIGLKSIRLGSFTLDQAAFNKNHMTDLKDLADKDGFYTIRSLVTSVDKQDVEFLSSMKAAMFLENGLSDVINVWVLPCGSVMAMNFEVNNTAQPLQMLHEEEYKINSKIYLNHVEQAPVPDTATYIQKLEREREARERGGEKDNRSFIAKYWMYIVPIAIFVMISGATNSEQGAQASR